MKQLSITKSGVLTNQASFETQEELDAWLNKHIGMGSFGSPALYEDQEFLVSEEVRGEVSVLVSEAVFNEYGEEIEPATYTIDPDGIIEPAIYETRSVLVREADYVVEILDISAQIAQEAANAEAEAFLAATDWMVIRAMERGEELSAEFKAERDAARLSIVR
jgi:hypothetical protein